MEERVAKSPEQVAPEADSRLDGFRGLSLLLRKGCRYLFNYRRVAMDQSRFKLIFSGSFMVMTLLALYGIFYGLFYFLDSFGGVGVMIINRLFALFFFGLGMLLTLSSTITAYSTFYQSP